MTIDDDVYRAARNLAVLKGVAIGAALSELARRGLDRPPVYAGQELPVFAVSERSVKFGLAEVQAAQDEI